MICMHKKEGEKDREKEEGKAGRWEGRGKEEGGREERRSKGKKLKEEKEKNQKF